MAFQWGPFSRKQLESIDQSTKRINIWEGAVRSGKTIASIVRWLEYIKTGPPGDLLMVGKTERTLKRNILDVIEDIVGGKHFKYNRGLGEVYIIGRKIYVVGANDERSEGKIRGMTLAGAYGDEVTLWPESFFKMLLSRLSIKGAKFFGTTNPEGPYHWLKKDYLDRENELSLARFHFLLEDNLNLDPEYIRQLKKEYVGVWFQRYIKGLWVLAEGLVYDMYDSNVHIISRNKLPDNKQEWIGIDYGTANDTVFILVRLGADNRLYIADEWRWGRNTKGRSMTDVQLRKELQKFILKNDAKPQWIFIDPSAASFITELYQHRKEFPAFKRVARANNNVLDGIQRVSSLLGAELLKVAEHCEGLREEFQSYSWDPKAQERGEDKPLKEHDHGLDALRYIINGIIKVYEYVLNAKMKEVA